MNLVKLDAVPAVVFICGQLAAFAAEGAVVPAAGEQGKVEARGSGATPAAPTTIGAHGLTLPATFRGDLPCADCAGIRYHLDLWPDQVFHLRRTWLGRDLVRDDIGRWRVDPTRGALVLHGGGEMPLQFEIAGQDRLRALDMQGRPAESKLPYDLSSDGTLTPTEVSLLLGGEMTFMADAARFTECLTGRSYPIAQEADLVALQELYRQGVKEPGAPLYVTLEGSIVDRPRMEGEGVERSVVVRRAINAWPSETCERSRADAALTNTYWRIVSLVGAAVKAEADRREPFLLVRDLEGKPGYSASVGCNQMLGGVTIEGSAIRFSPGATTLMACPPPLEALERALAETLGKARGWRIVGNTLELVDEAGTPVGLFQAVHF
ncbi:MAG: META domain-containing protein [Acidobacteriota bacterium]